MKTIIETDTGHSKYVFEDDINVTIEEDRIITDRLIILDFNLENSHLVSDIDVPADWDGHKYKLVDREWLVI